MYFLESIFFKRNIKKILLKNLLEKLYYKNFINVFF